MRDFQVFIQDEIHTHYHFVPAQDGSIICIDVIHFQGHIQFASWYGSGRAATGEVSFNHDTEKP